MDSEALALEKETSFRLKPDLFAQKLEGGAPSPPPNLEFVSKTAPPGNINKISPIHPGEILMEEFLVPMGISQYRLSRDISVPPHQINEIVHGIRRVRPSRRTNVHPCISTFNCVYSNVSKGLRTPIPVCFAVCR